MLHLRVISLIFIRCHIIVFILELLLNPQNKNRKFKRKMQQNSSEIFIYDFWLNFKKASFEWHYLVTFLHLLVGIISFGGNILVIVYYIR
jgi:hypothetical protein